MDQVIFATGGYDHTIKLWQTHTGICYKTLQHSDSQVNALAISPNNKNLAAASYQHIHMYDINSSDTNPIAKYEGTGKNVTDVGFQQDGRWMYSGGEDCRARIWDLLSLTSQCPKIFEAKSPVTCVCLHPNQVELFVGDQSGVIHRWDLKTDHNEQLIPEADAMILDIAIDPKGAFMAAVNSKGRCYIWSLKTGNIDEPTKLSPKHKFDAHVRYALKCQFSPDSKLLVTSSADQSARIWDTEDEFSLKQELAHEHQRWVWDVAFSSDSQYVFTASSDCYAKIWNVDSGTVVKEYSGHQKAITAIAFKDCSI